MLKVLLVIHHPLDINAGAAGVTLRLGAALEKLGCQVEYYGMDQAFPGQHVDSATFSLRFPWKLAGFLKKHGGRFDVVDASTGDSWVWAAMRRPSANQKSILVTRSHGLEHIGDAAIRKKVANNIMKVSHKYYFYHGGFRLWEVKKSMELADHVFMLNTADQDYASIRLNIASSKITVLPNGIDDVFFDSPKPSRAAEQVLKIAFIGTWIPRKGTAIFVDSVRRLRQQGVDISATIIGCLNGKEEVLKDFDESLHGHLVIVPRYVNKNLPQLLAGGDLLIFPSEAEGFGVAIVEAMACGLAPITTPVGVATTVVKSDLNGIIVPIGNVQAIVDSVTYLQKNPDVLLGLRIAAQESVKSFRWECIAAQTLSVYEQVIVKRSAPPSRL